MDMNQSSELTNDSIDRFLESLLDRAGIATVDEAVHADMIVQLRDVLNDFMMEFLVDKLSDEALDELAAIDPQDTEAVQTCLTTHIEDAQTVFASAFSLFEEVYLAGARQKQHQTL